MILFLLNAYFFNQLHIHEKLLGTKSGRINNPILVGKMHKRCYFSAVSEELAINSKCPATWDGWQCWADGGVPGQVEYSVCPNYIYFHSVDQFSCDDSKTFFSIMTLHKFSNVFRL